jgi:hypothetical protein
MVRGSIRRREVALSWVKVRVRARVRVQALFLEGLQALEEREEREYSP